MRCGTCEVWQLKEGDLYCSWCGAELMGLPSVSPEPLRFYCEPGAVSARAALTLSNNTHSPVEIQAAELPAWLRQIDKDTLRLPPGRHGRLEFALHPDRVGVLPAYHRIKLGVQPGDLTRDLDVEVWQTPEISVSEPLPVFWGRGQKVNLKIDCWQAVTLHGVEFDPPYLAFAASAPVQLAGEGEGEVPLVVTIGEGVEAKSYRLRCHFHVVGLEAPVTAEFDLVIRRPAVVQFQGPVGAQRLKILGGAENDVELAFANAGEAPLVVHKVEVDKSETAPPVSVLAPSDLPVIPPGQERVLELRITCNGEVPPGTHWLPLRLSSSDPVSSRNLIKLPLQVIDQDLTHFVAVDFGTTDSSVAVLHERSQRPQNLPLEGDQTKIYSNIFFIDYLPEAKPPYIWEIGAAAAHSGAGASLSNRFVKAIKTKIGEPGFQHEFHFPDKAVEHRTHRLSAEEIAGFILVDLLKRSQRKIRKHLTRFILCVPTRFTLRRKDILQSVFRKAAAEASLEADPVLTLDESLAAGLFYLLMRGPRDEFVRGREHYHLMLLDFGGGTTDITVFSVRQRVNRNGTVEAIHEVEIVGAWGDAELGGESITRRIAELLAQRFLTQLWGREPNRREIERDARRLEDEAEAVKIAVSELLRLGKDGREPGQSGFAESIRGTELWSNLGYLSAGVRQPEAAQVESCLQDFVRNRRVFSVASSDFPGLQARVSEEEVVQCYAGKLGDLRGELALLLGKIGIPQVDVLLLAGQSSQFPTVAEVLEGLAARIDFVRDETGRPLLKECVSLGALMYGQLMEARLPFRLRGLKRHWTRLGRARLDVPTGRSKFQEWIPWGTEYPCESKVFTLTRHHVVNGRLWLEVRENLSLGDDPRTHLYKRFCRDVADLAQGGEFPCRLRVDERGEVRAECRISQQWLTMERVE